jgi:EAL domain-containing protein (putative c-di-GMP-specific phosphodiesterase class I)
MLLALRAGKKADLSDTVSHMLDDFRKSYNKFRHDYKIIILETSDKISNTQDYVNLLDYIESRMEFNQEHFVSDDDIERFYNSSYILRQLEDIVQKKDLADERVLVYCQPVFNIKKGRYDTAEALMRLKLEQTGMVFPDQFIPLAEKYNLIHSLSLVILNKTCAAVRDFIEEGYELRRISVNFSEIDIRYKEFCSEVQKIIDRNGIPYDKIAVEITESRSDADFNIMKEKVLELQKLGIKFYLDDFGTGYSNFERIMEIPFDIIKFDRSMLIESNKSESSKYMVNTFANMFNNLKYAVLFEGVENADDEQNCMNMNAKYLQGYKYSKPIPIEQLRDFLSKAEEPEAGAG